jgi:hypothetical protein
MVHRELQWKSESDHRGGEHREQPDVNIEPILETRPFTQGGKASFDLEAAPDESDHEESRFPPANDDDARQAEVHLGQGAIMPRERGMTAASATT